MTGIINTVARKLRRQSPSPAPPAQPNSTYLDPGNQWYYPSIAGPSSYLPDVVGAGPVRAAAEILDKLSTDPYLEFVRKFYAAGLQTFGDHWVYADINTVLIGLATRLNVESYLEIGVRRGRSMAMVTTSSPMCTIAGFDLWIADYAGMENPGPDYVRSELARLGYKGELSLVAGDSRHTIPEWFAAHPDAFFDLITVDGDHSTEGARNDLENVLPRLKIGGALVFDDISNQSHANLAAVWEDFLERHSNLSGYSFTEVGFGVGFAIRSR
ncbi:MAG TPA: class I SAM-dependent methyltransferase [Gemmatimonadaceae bacterium]|nr:class I SAM-dependent methyltransferase [Gemmatimonadaceae bacterium]